MKKGFTLAEILITLTIIGIVASITIPSLINNIYDRVWETKREALYSRLSMALSAMPKLNGYGEFKTGTDAIDTAAESFIVDGLSKVYKIKAVCGAENITQCGLTHSFTDSKDATKTFPADLRKLAVVGISSTSAISPAYFETNNGDGVMVYYNPYCTYPRSGATSIDYIKTMCVNFIYDLNGKDVPNQLGKDIGIITAFLGADKEVQVVSPKISALNIAEGGKTWAQAMAACKEAGDYRIPSMYEMASLLVNGTFFNISVPYVGGTNWNTSKYWTSNSYSAGPNGKAWMTGYSYQHWGDGSGSSNLSAVDKTSPGGVYCIEQ